MRVGIFHPSFKAVGGAELLAAMHATYLRGQGVDVQLATFAFDPTRWLEHLHGIPVHTVTERHWLDSLVAWHRLGKLQRRGRRASRYLSTCDLVVAHNYPCSTMLGASEIRARKVWYCNEPPRGLYLRGCNPALSAHVAAAGDREDSDVCVRFARRLREYDEQLALRRSLHAQRAFDMASVGKLDAIYAISEFTRENVERAYGRCPEAVIPAMVRFSLNAPHRMGLDRSGLKVLVLSRLEPEKNVDTVLRGFARFRERVCRSAQLHVVGEGGHESRLKGLARQLCPDEAIRFHGYLHKDELRPVCEACDVFVLLPVDEPFGMVFPEAAANGLLLVGPDHGGPMEILDGGRLGWVCDAFSPEALAERLAEIWALDDATVNQRRQEADRACRARYAPAVVGPQLLHALTHGR